MFVSNFHNIIYNLNKKNSNNLTVSSNSFTEVHPLDRTLSKPRLEGYGYQGLMTPRTFMIH